MVNKFIVQRFNIEAPKVFQIANFPIYIKRSETEHITIRTTLLYLQEHKTTRKYCRIGYPNLCYPKVVQRSKFRKVFNSFIVTLFLYLITLIQE